MPQYRRRCPNPNAKAPPEVADDGDECADESYNHPEIASPSYQRRPPISKDAGVPDAIRESRYGESVVKKIRGRGLIEIDNSRVVPFNPYLLAKYNCHINVEWVYGEKCVNYLMKYIMKGHDLAYVKVSKEVSQIGGADKQYLKRSHFRGRTRSSTTTSMSSYARSAT